MMADQKGKIMDRERRHILEDIAFGYMIGELEMEPITARRKAEEMTDEELEKFIE
nr:MAG TPA: hypothetical protein [Caudoviricetes sp.]